LNILAQPNFHSRGHDQQWGNLVQAEGTRKGLERAAAIIARAVKARAAVFSESIPPTVESHIGRDDAAYVTAGGPDGKTAPAAYMSEVAGTRHMLYGNRRHWYDQPHRPFMTEGSDDALDEAADGFADEAIDGIARDNGFK
jgi:hypothetical protein